MKKLLLIAALASLSAPAFASKARVTALGNADHLVDPQSAFDNPSHLTLMGDYVTFEAGATTPAATGVVPGTTTWAEYYNGIATPPGAEGGFVRSHGDAKYGAYLGRRSPFTDVARNSFGFLRQENPIELQYAMKGAINWGAALNYSSSDQKSLGQKQSAYGIRLGATADQWEGFAVIGLASTADGAAATRVLNSGDANGNGIIDAATDTTAIAADSSAKYKGTIGFKVGGAYKMENIRLYAKYYMDGFKYEGASAVFNDLKVEQNQADIGVVDHNKIDGGQWFYGVALQLFNAKKSNSNIDTKVTATYLPFLVGLEYDATSWLTLRGSATQNVLLGSYKQDDGAAGFSDETDTIRNNTKVAAGLGLKFGKWAVDGSWAAQTTGTVNTTNLMTNLGMTYMF